MRRKIYDKLLEWKSRGGATALLVKGARRVGKSHIVEEFAKNEYKSYIKIDFNDISPDNLNYMVESLHDRDRLFAFLQIAYNTKLYERKSLIFFDEIQECPRVRAAIKYFVADGRYDFISTGSLLSIKKNVQNIVIPSEEEHIELNPMDFEEWLWAKNETLLADYIKDCYSKKVPLSAPLHRKAIQLFREYMIVGGMPQVVKKYINTNDFNEADREKQTILSLYRGDIDKHAGKYSLKVQTIYDAIPSELSKHEKKFSISGVSKGARMRNFIEPFAWLQDARFANLCFRTTQPNIALALDEDRLSLKCYLADTGLLIALAFNSLEEKQDVYRKIILGKLELNKGMLVENVVAQMFVASGHKLFYYSNSSQTDKNSRMELDFLLPKNKTTSRHNINIIEVKSGTRYSLTSLGKAKEKFAKEINQLIVLHSENSSLKNDFLYLPLYMAHLL